MKRKKKFSWSSLVYNNRLMLALSFVAAFCIWVVMMYNNTDVNQTWKIDNVPITVEYTTGAVEKGLKVYNLSRNAVSVSISGNSLAIRQVKAENIEVVATVTESMANEQNNTLTLSARKKGEVLVDFSITSIDPGTVTAEIDVAREASFQIENGITASVEQGYFMESPQFSTETVTISGPESVVSRIARVVAEYEFSEPLSETKDFSAELVLYDEAGERIESDYLTLSTETVDVRLTVLWQEEVPLVASFTNRPASFPENRISIEPESVTFAGLREGFDTFQDISLTPIDFSNIDLSTRTFNVDIVTPEGFVNVSNYQSATITVNLEGYSEKWVSVGNITPVNVADGIEATVLNQSLEVLVVGPANDVARITDQDIYAQVNMSNRQEIGTAEVPVTVGIQDNTSCWVAGSYVATVTTSEASASSS